MMRKIIEQSCGHPLENQKILQTKDMTCVACSKGKLITRPSPAKVGFRLGPCYLTCSNINSRQANNWSELSLSHLNPRTKECELEVQKIIHLQGLANQLPDTFTDPKRVTKSHVPTANAPIKIDVPEGQNNMSNESRARLKRGRPLGSKDKNPRKKKGANNQNGHIEVNETPRESPEETLDMLVPKEPQTELNSLTKREVFGPVVRTPEGVKPVGYKWVFVRKHNEKNEIVRYKARLVAQGFSQRPEIDYEETYSPVVDATTFRYLISLVIQEGIDMRLMDVVTAYLYGSLDTDIYMKLLEGLKLPESCKIEHLKDGILVHQETYIEKVLKRFYMDKSHPLSTPMVVRSLDVEKDPFRPPTDDEDILGPEVPYLSAIGALMFLAGHTRPDISFSLNLLARYSSCPMRRHWNGVKQIFQYLQGTKDLGLYFANPSKGSLYGFADDGCLLDPHTGRFQTGYVFTMGGTAISWRSTKQTMIATSSNHAEILAIHEASRECVWLRNVIQHIRGSCGIITDKEPPTVLYENNMTCIAQLKEGYIKGDRTKHILPKFFFTHDLQKSGDISIQQVRSCENVIPKFKRTTFL
ncbi:hypothetical protein OSB04_016287 [Centaurea solstitialis]|uniref:Reverse transcriptase Ty1/copia-type domain-containing protein n=1 Tax=Centaurea solstitialis TaxID=347529 RepID=A0AA38W9N7_9ASTR|nr:hypothetical protein OSB04_016287 [Centaurea solstitialis]